MTLTKSYKELIIDEVLKHEGGWFDDPLGGPTNRGITYPVYVEYCKAHKLVASKSAFRDYTEKEIREIYYWLYVKYGAIRINDYNTTRLFFDCSVNHGNSRAIKWLQAAAGVTVDGVFGPKTTEAVNDTDNVNKIYVELIKTRILFIGKIVVKDPTKKLINLNGWLKRACAYIK